MRRVLLPAVSAVFGLALALATPAPLAAQHWGVYSEHHGVYSERVGARDTACLPWHAGRSYAPGGATVVEDAGALPWHRGTTTRIVSIRSLTVTPSGVSVLSPTPPARVLQTSPDERFVPYGPGSSYDAVGYYRSGPDHVSYTWGDCTPWHLGHAGCPWHHGWHHGHAWRRCGPWRRGGSWSSWAYGPHFGDGFLFSSRRGLLGWSTGRFAISFGW